MSQHDTPDRCHPPREIEPLNGQRRARCPMCEMTFPIAGDRHYDGTRYWRPLDITVLLNELDAARVELARVAALVTAAEEHKEAVQTKARIAVEGGWSQSDFAAAINNVISTLKVLGRAALALASERAAGSGEGE